MKILFVIVLLLFCVRTVAQEEVLVANDSLSVTLFERGTRNVNKCTPWHHMQCVYITATEVYKDGSEGKPTRHWWRMSYIGRACTSQHGTVFGQIFEGFFAIPHYIAIGVGNSVGYVKYLLRGSPEKIEARKRKRNQKRLLREARRKKRHGVS
ncbi:hypothetical protein [uncultured Aquimarina sp.]|uniref:hypothetical protein n=1 Tax=uncultured Aquimarina sp. TaxID=575652 RepID=UPI00261BE70A|nr:hypothetical protein [uncultured Aquimarina sp.]